MTASRATVHRLTQSQSLRLTVTVPRTRVGVTSVSLIEKSTSHGLRHANAHMAFFKRFIRTAHVPVFAQARSLVMFPPPLLSKP